MSGVKGLREDDGTLYGAAMNMREQLEEMEVNGYAQYKKGDELRKRLMEIRQQPQHQIFFSLCQTDTYTTIEQCKNRIREILKRKNEVVTSETNGGLITNEMEGLHKEVMEILSKWKQLE
jgi:homoserine dehydrogenase